MDAIVWHFLIGFPLAIILSNIDEWFFHKYVLHGLGKRKSSFWSFHWHEHHGQSRRNGMLDEHYRQPLNRWNGQTKEALVLVLSAIAVIPLFWVVPGFVAGLWYSALNYYIRHRKSHLDPEWAKKHLPWHFDHHMAPNQDANWCVTRPWFDMLMKTRIPYHGTEREKQDLEKQKLRAKAA